MSDETVAPAIGKHFVQELAGGLTLSKPEPARHRSGARAVKADVATLTLAMPVASGFRPRPSPGARVLSLLLLRVLLSSSRTFAGRRGWLLRTPIRSL